MTSNSPILDYSQQGLRDIPEEVFGYESIGCLDLSYNELEFLPESIGDLVGLQSLSLTGNERFTGSFPSTMKDLRELTAVEANQCAIRTISENLTSIPNLQVLDLSSNPLGKLSDRIGDFKHLTQLYLGYTGLSKLPSAIKKLKSLQTLDLQNNPDLTELPKHICHLKNLAVLNLTGINMYRLPSCMSHMSSLEEITGLNRKLESYFN